MSRLLSNTPSVTCLALAVLLLSGRLSYAQEGLAAAKELYLAASYEEALTAIERMPASDRDRSVEALQFRAFSLMALQRNDEARVVIEEIYKLDPMYRVDETQASPRMQSAFHAVRRTVLPDTVQREYTKARELFERKDPQSIVMFSRVLALLDDPDMEGNVAPDFRTVVAGFRDLSRLALSAPPPQPSRTSPPAAPPATAASTTAAPTGAAPAASTSASAAPSAAPTPRPSPPTVSTPPPPPTSTLGTSTAGVVPPVAVSRALPRWEPPPGAAKQVFEGELEVSVDQRGDVTAATLLESIHPSYDQLLLRAARLWKFKPATLNGTPISFVVTMPIRLQAP